MIRIALREGIVRGGIHCGRFVTSSFSFGDRHSARVVAALVAINAVVMINACLHDYGAGYDAEAHQRYVNVLASGRLPSPGDTSEFFSAPLPYLLPAVAHSLHVVRFGLVLKGAQFLNVAYSLILTLFLVRYCRLIRSDDERLPLVALLLLGTLPVYYKTMAMVRGEALDACLAIVCLYQSILLIRSTSIGRKQVIVLGVSLGLLILAKQWGFAVLAAILIVVSLALIRTQPFRQTSLVLGSLVLVICLVSGWFYASLYQRFGSIAAFNHAAPSNFSLANRSPTFLTLRPGTLFSNPVRPAFDDYPFVPLFYADTWGDYWCYWVVYQTSGGGACRDPLDTKSNRAVTTPYLGRANIASLAPSLIYLIGILIGVGQLFRWVWGATTNESAAAPLGLLALALCGSLVGYLLLLVRYPDLHIKAAYMLQIFPMGAVLGADALCRIRRKSPLAYEVLILILVCCLLFDSPILFTRYFQFHRS